MSIEIIMKNLPVKWYLCFAKLLSSVIVLLGVSGNGAATGVGLLGPCRCPSHDGRGTVRREVLVEHASVPVCLLGVGNVVAPLGLGVLHVLVADVQLGGVLETVDPAVTNTVTELLLLSPEDVVGQVGLLAGLVGCVECLADDVLFNVVLVDQLGFGINVHRVLEELLVQEGHSGLETPSRSRLVGSQAVCQMKVAHSADSLLMEGLLVGCVVEVEVATEDLVTALTTENHLDTHSLDLSAEKEHGGGSTNGGNVVGLEMEDDIRKSVKTLLDGESKVVVLGAQELGDLKGSLAVGSARQTNGEGVELRENGDSVELVVLVNTSQLLLAVSKAVLLLLCIVCGLQSQSLSLCDGSDQTGVQTTRQENTVGNLSHQTLSNSSLELCSQSLEIDGSSGNVGGLDQPLGSEVLGDLVGLGVVDVARRESDDVVANGVKTLELGSEEDGAGGSAGATHVEGGDTDGISGSNDSVLLLVVEDPREHAIEELGSVDTVLHVLCDCQLRCSSF